MILYLVFSNRYDILCCPNLPYLKVLRITGGDKRAKTSSPTYDYSMKVDDSEEVKAALGRTMDWNSFIASMDRTEWNKFYIFTTKQKNFERIKDYVYESSAQKAALEEPLDKYNIQNAKYKHLNP